MAVLSQFLHARAVVVVHSSLLFAFHSAILFVIKLGWKACGKEITKIIRTCCGTDQHVARLIALGSVVSLAFSLWKRNRAKY